MSNICSICDREVENRSDLKRCEDCGRLLCSECVRDGQLCDFCERQRDDEDDEYQTSSDYDFDYSQDDDDQDGESLEYPSGDIEVSSDGNSADWETDYGDSEQGYDFDWSVGDPDFGGSDIDYY